MILFIAFFLVVGTLFLTYRSNLLHAIQLTLITCRLSLLYIFLCYFKSLQCFFFPLISIVSITQFQSILICILFLFSILQLTTINKSLFGNILLLFFPNLIFFYLIYFDYLTFNDFSTLLLVLQLMVICFYWVYVLLDKTHEFYFILSYIQCYPQTICYFQFISCIISHFIYNIFILYHILYFQNYSFNFSSWKLIHLFIISYIFILVLCYVTNRKSAQNYFLPYYPDKTNLLFLTSMFQSRSLLLHHYQNYFTGLWDKERVYKLLSKKFMTTEQILCFINGLLSKEFICWIFIKFPSHFYLYQEGFIYLASFLPYDILYCNEIKDGCSLFRFWIFPLIYFGITFFVNLVFLCFL